HILGFYRIYAFPWRPDRNAEFLPLDAQGAKSRTNGETPRFHPQPDDTAESNGETPRFHPQPDDTAEHKDANRREGEELLNIIVGQVGQGRLIGEDLGEVPDYVRPSLRSLG